MIPIILLFLIGDSAFDRFFHLEPGCVMDGFGNFAAPLRGGLAGGQRLFDDASLRLAKGRRLLEPCGGFWGLAQSLVAYSHRIERCIVYSRYIPRVYIIYTEYMYCLGLGVYMLICSDHLLLKPEIFI